VLCAQYITFFSIFCKIMDIRHHIIFLPQNKTNIRIQNLYMLRERPTSASAGREIGAPLQRERNREEEEQQQTRARGQNSGAARVAPDERATLAGRHMIELCL
jgi:hypothetical protein